MKSIVNQLPLSDVQRLELHQLLQSETGEPGVYLTRSGYKTLFLQWVAYSRFVFVVVVQQTLNKAPPH